MQPESIARSIATAFAAVAVVTSAWPLPTRLAAQAVADRREAPAYVSLFAPAGRSAAYRAWTWPSPLDAVLRMLEGDPWLLRPPGAWEARSLAAVDAFGRSGAYDRTRLARLYGARVARVARGPRTAGGRVTESWTLISPYPNPALDRLEPGPLLLVLALP